MLINVENLEAGVERHLAQVLVADKNVSAEDAKTRAKDQRQAGAAVLAAAYQTARKALGSGVREPLRTALAYKQAFADLTVWAQQNA